MWNIVLAGVLGIAFSALQLLLMQMVAKVQGGLQRGLLMMLKIPLWALAFIGIFFWLGTWPLLTFGIAAGSTYLAVAILYYIRTHPAHHKGKGE